MLQNDLASITAQGQDGLPCAVPIASYPYLRYTRHEVDGWPEPFTTAMQAERLAATVDQIRMYLRQKFNKKL